MQYFQPALPLRRCASVTCKPPQWRSFSSFSALQDPPFPFFWMVFHLSSSKCSLIRGTFTTLLQTRCHRSCSGQWQWPPSYCTFQSLCWQRTPAPLLPVHGTGEVTDKTSRVQGRTEDISAKRHLLWTSVRAWRRFHSFGLIEKDLFERSPSNTYSPQPVSQHHSHLKETWFRALAISATSGWSPTFLSSQKSDCCTPSTTSVRPWALWTLAISLQSTPQCRDCPH